MPRELLNTRRVFLSTDLADRREVRFALAAVVVSAAFFIAAAPFAKHSLPHIDAFIPAYESALVLSDLITSALLYSQFNITRSQGLLVLASGYLFTAVIATAHVLEFPGVFSPTGLLGAGRQSAPWLWTFWHMGFPIVIVLYVLASAKERRTNSKAAAKGSQYGTPGFAIPVGTGIALAAAIGLALLVNATQDLLPELIVNGRYTLAANVIWNLTWIMSFIALLVLWWQRPYTVLNLWLMVVICAWLFDIALSAVFNAARYDIGWYAGRLYGLFAATSLLFALLIENGRHYARLVQMEGKYRGLLEAAPDAMVVVNTAGEIVLLNVQAENQFGYHRDELLGQKITNLIPNGFAEQLIADGLKSAETLLPQQIGTGLELQARRKDGSQFPIELMLSPMENIEGTLVTAAIRDITARKLAEERLVLSVKELSRSNEELGHFAYVASHDLQEPLRMVNSYLRLLSMRYKGKLDSDADEFIAFAVDGANRMAGLIQDLLAYSRVGSKGKVLVGTSSEGALQQAIKNLHSSIKESGALVTHDLLPTVMADSGQLIQLFQNLVGNAIKYQNSGIPKVHVSATMNGTKKWNFSVTDNGIGIEPAHFGKIFGMFQRLHGREEFSGTGIGLAICKKIVERHGDNISVESQLGHGSVFRFALESSEINLLKKSEIK